MCHERVDDQKKDGNEFPFVSIIIPTFNDGELLKSCIQSLARQTYPQDSYEIIVVNNNPQNPLPPELREISQIKLEQESKKGSYAARNRGIKVAKGEIIAFTDADCQPAFDWLETGVKGLINQPDYQLLAGRIEISIDSQNNCTPFELYELAQAFNQKQYVERDRYAATANLFVYKAVFGSVGEFNEVLQSGGDFEWGRRASSQGHTLTYADDVKIYHPARKTLGEMVKKTKRVTLGHCVLMENNLYPKRRYVLATFADLLFPYRFATKIIFGSKIKGTRNKFRAAGVSILMRYIRMFYRVRTLLEYSLT